MPNLQRGPWPILQIHKGAMAQCPPPKYAPETNAFFCSKAIKIPFKQQRLKLSISQNKHFLVQKNDGFAVH